MKLSGRFKIYISYIIIRYFKILYLIFTLPLTIETNRKYLHMNVISVISYLAYKQSVTN